MVEATVKIETYRELVTLRNGIQVLLRPMASDDCQTLVDLFATATDEDVRYLRDNIRDPAVARGWCDNLDYGRVFPLIAVVDEQAAGQATLHFGCGPERHCGKVRIFVARDFRRRGLGSRMLSALIDVARGHGLQFLMAEVVSDQASVIRTFMHAGFKLCFTLQDAFMLPTGETRGVATLKLCLRPPCDEFGMPTEE
ncbi:MAG TPA: GNAT family N-acetyltransferase [Anaerolineales bacterium]|nr:GNAT family N-acetyltransferase [Anaerolineales bacterium]